MRPVGITLAAVLLAALAGRAQPPAAPPGAPAADPKLDPHLAGWEKAMGQVSNFAAKFELTRVTNDVFKRERKYTGSVLCNKPNFARLRLDSTAPPPPADPKAKTKPKVDYEAYICNGKSIYAYIGLEETITEVPLASPAGAAGGDNLMIDFLSGMKAADAKKRFQISQFNPQAEHYVYLDIKPVLAKDKQEFEFVRIALYGPKVLPPYTPYLPAQVYLQKPNGDTEMWKFSEQKTNIPGLKPEVFEPVKIPGWQFKQAPPAPPPGVGGPPKLPGGTGLPPGPGAVKRP